MRKAGIAVVEKALVKAFGGGWERHTAGPGRYTFSKDLGKVRARFSRRRESKEYEAVFDWSIFSKGYRYPPVQISGDLKSTHHEAIRQLELQLKDLAFIVKKMKSNN